MASLGPPSLGLHLADPAHTPIVSSASLDTRSSSADFRALTDLTVASLTAYASSSRLGLGLPRRILIETSKDGPVILHSFLNPQSSNRQTPTDINGPGPNHRNGNGNASAVLDQTREALRPMSGSTVDDADAEPPAAEDSSHNDGSENITVDSDSLVNGQPVENRLDKGKGLLEEDVEPEQINGAEEEQLAPLLVATVVSPSHSHEARRSIGKLERLGREFQRKWFREQPVERVAVEEDEETADG